jgi:hypothetical protein
MKWRLSGLEWFNRATEQQIKLIYKALDLSKIIRSVIIICYSEIPSG